MASRALGTTSLLLLLPLLDIIFLSFSFCLGVGYCLGWNIRVYLVPRKRFYAPSGFPVFVIFPCIREQRPYHGAELAGFRSCLSDLLHSAPSPCIKHVGLPKQRGLFRHPALIFPAVRQGLPRRITLSGKKFLAVRHISNFQTGRRSSAHR